MTMKALNVELIEIFQAAEHYFDRLYGGTTIERLVTEFRREYPNIRKSGRSDDRTSVLAQEARQVPHDEGSTNGPQSRQP